MTNERDTAARELLAFYQEAGVDALVGESPVNRFAEPSMAEARTGQEAPPARAPLPPAAAPSVGPATITSF